MIAGVQRLGDTFHIGEILGKVSLQIMSSRRARELPIIDIGGTDFYLDLRLNQFREVANWANQINLDHLYDTPRGYKFWFDTMKKNLFLGTPEEFRANPNAIALSLPSNKVMDPLGYVWLMEEQGWLSADDAKKQTEKLLKDYVIHESGLIMQRKPLEKKGNQLLPKLKSKQNRKKHER